MTPAEIAAKYARNPEELADLTYDIKVMMNAAYQSAVDEAVEYKEDHTGELYLAGEHIESQIRSLMFTL
jgi:membrane peptidoglycan carboxypeptidase